ncbi:MAG: hypothetical protein MUC28_02880 [Planctomycetes bacterium]|jgi:hypothetical protein|nr:hypothetical protein [Planctomycetota bacterium]
MPEPMPAIDQGVEIIGWAAPEYEKHPRTKIWYIAASTTAMALLLFAFWTSNFLFAVIIVVASLVIILHDGHEPLPVNISLTEEGVVIGRRFYDYDELKNFAVVYKPSQGVKNLYFEFKNSLRPRLSIPLADMNPLPIRQNLLKYLPEDLERTDQPLSETLAKLFKL